MMSVSSVGMSKLRPPLCRSSSGVAVCVSSPARFLAVLATLAKPLKAFLLYRIRIRSSLLLISKYKSVTALLLECARALFFRPLGAVANLDGISVLGRRIQGRGERGRNLGGLARAGEGERCSLWRGDVAQCACLVRRYSTLLLLLSLRCASYAPALVWSGSSSACACTSLVF